MIGRKEKSLLFFIKDKDIHTSFIGFEENDSGVNVNLQAPYTNHVFNVSEEVCVGLDVFII